MKNKKAKTKRKNISLGGKFLFGIIVICAFVGVIAFILLVPSSLLRTQTLSEEEDSCDCEAGYSYVCAADGHTYTSICEGECTGRRIKHLGECL